MSGEDSSEEFEYRNSNSKRATPEKMEWNRHRELFSNGYDSPNDASLQETGLLSAEVPSFSWKKHRSKGDLVNSYSNGFHTRKLTMQQNPHFKRGNSYDESGSDEGSADEKEDLNQEGHDASQLSLILKDDPKTSIVLMLYLKWYSELLYSWGETHKAIQACKLISHAFDLLQKYKRLNDEKQLSTMNGELQREDSFNEMDITLTMREAPSISMIQKIQFKDNQPNVVMLATDRFGDNISIEKR